MTECSICSTEIDEGEGIEGFIGLIPFAFCPTCKAGIYDWAMIQWGPDQYGGVPDE